MRSWEGNEGYRRGTARGQAHILTVFNTYVVVECLTLLLRSREVPGSHHGPEIDYAYSD